ncbi:MAG TPA: HD domain-containing protein [Epsilonproteobacteria bacterium]|nr:HD domain-containing protein [Campylobacterota bacterium]
MRNRIYKKNVDVLRIENQKSLEIKMSQCYQMYDNNIARENALIDLMVTELIMHGKDANQIRQISQISKILGLSLGLGTRYCDTLEKASKIYDIGNIAIASEVYEKDDALSFEEFEGVKQHTLFGYDILQSQDLPSLQLGAVISREHHEWWNGGGYPSQLKSKEINIASRIVAVADTVGALFRSRPGRSTWSYEKILEYLNTRATIQFDSDVIDVFLINQEAIHEILMTDLDTVPSAWYA